jgi:hypothetical protein
MPSSDITSLAILALPLVLLLAGWLFRKIDQRMPDKMHAMLVRCADIVTKTIEMQGSGFSSERKKDEAVKQVELLFRAARLPVPPIAIISIAIEAAVYAMNERQQGMITSQQAQFMQRARLEQ